MTEPDRAAAMVRRLARSARRAGADAEALHLAFERAIELRAPVIRDPGDPDFLHPGRTALILLEDAGITDTSTIAAAVLHDSSDARFSEGPGVVEEIGGPAAAAIVVALEALRHAEHRLEMLLALDTPARLAALAERLDHARHLHLRPQDTWAAFHASIRAVDVPAASRTHPVLDRRLRFWVGMFEQRFLRT